jgi:hypothetical protein
MNSRTPLLVLALAASLTSAQAATLGGPDGTQELARKRAEVNEGRSVGLGNQALRIEQPRIEYRGRDAIIHLTVTNTSDQRIASADLRARGYLSGREGFVVPPPSARPMVNRRAPDAQPVSLRFGEVGLAPGQTRTIAHPLGIDSFVWSPPDAVAARGLQLVIRVERTFDGTRQPFGGTAPGFEAVGAR